MNRVNKSLALLLTLIIAFSGFLLICSVHIVYCQNVSVPSTFAITIVASVNNYSSTCIFGLNPDLSYNGAYSPKYDSVASTPSSGIFCYFSYPNQTQLMLKLSTYILPTNGYVTWFLEVNNIDQYGTLKLSWNDTSVESMTLENGASEQVYADMNAVSTYSLATSPGNDIGFIIVYQSPGTPSPTPTPTPSPSPTPTPTLPPSVPIPTPSVPEFSVNWVNTSYEVPTSYSINPYTGENETSQGYYVDNSSIVKR